ncbi:MAG: acylphosphatase [Calditrichaeota bacterium]|nr:MAG: acylphosphatase [Calditrichota bacterium]
MMKKISIQVFGRVQGVGFRYFVQEQAVRLGINGEVRNESDGTVLIHAQASADAMVKFISLVEKGPSFSRVSHLVKQDLQNDIEYTDFQITF